MNEPRKLFSPLDDELKRVLAPSDKLSDAMGWIQNNYKIALAAAMILFMILFGCWRNNQRQWAQIQQLHELKHTWMEGTSERASLLDPIEQLLKKHPEWMGSWKGTYLQTALSLNRVDIVEQWLHQPPARLIDGELSALFDEATRISIDLNQEKWQATLPRIEAWLASPATQARSASSPALELCRLQLLSQKALIHAKLNQVELEKASWHELLSKMGIDAKQLQLATYRGQLPLHYTAWLESYGQGRINLLDYIDYRLKH